jgi:alginate O-acetyltransferase complex protein AlgJ
MAWQPRTSSRQGLVRHVSGLILLLVLGGSAALTLTNPQTFSSPGRATLLDGQWTDAYERHFEEGLALRRPALAAWALLRYGLFAEGSPGVLVGRDGWLFTAEEFQIRWDPAAPARVDLDTVREARDELAVRGVKLVIALVPAKARVYSKQLGRYSLPRELTGRYQELLARLAGLGIPAPDLLGPLLEGRRRGEVFLRTDTHWTPLGAQVAAEALADTVKELLSQAGSPRARFVSGLGQPREYRGDLLNFIPLGPVGQRFGPPPDRIVERVTSPEDLLDTGLFDRLHIPVVLVGTSYSAGALWNLEGALKTAVAADVLNVAEEGQGPLSPLRALLPGSVLEDVQADVVVWEIPERYFSR